jgi:hypothetical protein
VYPGTQRSCAITSNASSGVSFGSGTIGVGCWPRTTGARNNKKAMARINIGIPFILRGLCETDLGVNNYRPYSSGIFSYSTVSDWLNSRIGRARVFAGGGNDLHSEDEAKIDSTRLNSKGRIAQYEQPIFLRPIEVYSKNQDIQCAED